MESLGALVNTCIFYLNLEISSNCFQEIPLTPGQMTKSMDGCQECIRCNRQEI